MKKIIIAILKITAMVAMLGYLAWDAQKHDSIDDLLNQSKNWWLLLAAWCSCATAVTLTLVRWCYLVRALGIRLPMTDALRIGFLGYLFNLAPMGIVGGDLLKAVLLAKREKERRPEAVASVFVDRMVGLYMLFVVAIVAIFVTGFWQIDNSEVQIACRATLILAVLGTLGVIAVLAPDPTHGKSTALLGKIPIVGEMVEKLARAVQLYREKKGVLLLAALMSVAVHSFFSLGVFLIASGLYDTLPTLKQHFVLSPLSAATGVIPLAVGPFEIVLNLLYPLVPIEGTIAVKAGQGTVVALGYRVVCVLIAGIGYCYYLASREEMAEVLHEPAVDSEPTGQADPQCGSLPAADGLRT